MTYDTLVGHMKSLVVRCRASDLFAMKAKATHYLKKLQQHTAEVKQGIDVEQLCFVLH